MSAAAINLAMQAVQRKKRTNKYRSRERSRSIIVLQRAY
jgi:hypothetical protein